MFILFRLFFYQSNYSIWLTLAKVCRVRFEFLNKNYSLYNELKSIVRKTIGLDVIKDKIREKRKQKKLIK